MTRRDLWFYVPALVSALAVTRLATLPAAFNAKALVFMVGAAMITLAWRFYIRAAPPQRWVLLLFGAPVASFSMLFATLEWAA